MKGDDHEAPPPTEEPVEGGGEISGALVLVPDGEYELRYMYYKTAYFMDQAKVIVYCVIIEPEYYAGLPIERFYNVDTLTGPAKKYGNFKTSPYRDIYREIDGLLGPPGRTDRLNPGWFRDKRLIGELKLVTSTYDKRPLLPEHQYSRIKRFIRIIPEDEQ